MKTETMLADSRPDYPSTTFENIFGRLLVFPTHRAQMPRYHTCGAAQPGWAGFFDGVPQARYIWTETSAYIRENAAHC